jgi:hypothetical protein
VHVWIYGGAGWVWNGVYSQAELSGFDTNAQIGQMMSDIFSHDSSAVVLCNIYGDEANMNISTGYYCQAAADSEVALTKTTFTYNGVSYHFNGTCDDIEGYSTMNNLLGYEDLIAYYKLATVELHGNNTLFYVYQATDSATDSFMGDVYSNLTCDYVFARFDMSPASNPNAYTEYNLIVNNLNVPFGFQFRDQADTSPGEDNIATGTQFISSEFASGVPALYDGSGLWCLSTSVFGGTGGMTAPEWTIWDSWTYTTGG